MTSRFVVVVLCAMFVPAAVTASNAESETRDPVIAAAGDIACAPSDPDFNNGRGTSETCAQARTADLVLERDFDAVLALGDLQYRSGSLDEFRESYDLSWGRFKNITYPVAGNHETLTPGSRGYFDYFNGEGDRTGRAGERGKGYYSFDLGKWHLIALNSNCGDEGVEGGCSYDSPQLEWLRSDLEKNPATCTLAFWHVPRFSSSSSEEGRVSAFWRVLYEYDADVVLNGHSHAYERFQRSEPDGDWNRAGIRQFVVGTGGRSHSDGIENRRLSNTTGIFDNETFGILRMTLHPTSYEWRFIPEAEAPGTNTGSEFTDSGSAGCH
jgi:acid phosphatase type 7